jgi:hypothetical protein
LRAAPPAAQRPDPTKTTPPAQRGVRAAMRHASRPPPGAEDEAMTNALVRIELATKDVNKAKEFYGSVFEWQLEDVRMGNGATYTMIKPGEGPGGGMMKQPMPVSPRPGWRTCQSPM